MPNSDSEYESADEAVNESKNKQQENVSQPDPSTQQRSGWRSWGAVNILSNASKHVASITTQVSNSIYDTINQQPVDDEKNSSSETPTESKIPSSTSSFRLVDDLLSESTNFVRDIGKKTINLIQEAEPLSNLQSSNLPNLSQMLKEAKEQNDETAEGSNTAKLETVSFEQLLDDYTGCMSLEALEMLSNQSKMKIELMLKSLNDKKATEELEETLDEVKELCDFDSEGDFDSLNEENISNLFGEIDLLDTRVDFAETTEKVKHVKESLAELKDQHSHVIYENAKKILAKICSLGLHNLHKFAENLLNKSHRSTASEAESLLEIATIYCSIFSYIASNYNEIIVKDSDEARKAATNIFLESSNATTHIKRAVDLFIPIIQISVI